MVHPSGVPVPGHGSRPWQAFLVVLPAIATGVIGYFFAMVMRGEPETVPPVVVTSTIAAATSTIAAATTTIVITTGVGPGAPAATVTETVPAPAGKTATVEVSVTITEERLVPIDVAVAPTEATAAEESVISLAEACALFDGGNYKCKESRDRNVEIGDNVFHYELEQSTNGSSYPYWTDAVNVPETGCSHMSLKFGLAGTDLQEGTAYLQVKQASGKPDPQSVERGSVGSLETDLNGGPFVIQVSGHKADTRVFVSGNLVCPTK